MSEYKEINIEELQVIEVRNDKKNGWIKRFLIQKLSNGCVLCLDGKGSYGAWNYHRPIPQTTKREMTPFEARVWCDENNAQLVYMTLPSKNLVLDASSYTDDDMERHRYISNSKIKELKGQVTWEDCSEFPMIEEGEE